MKKFLSIALMIAMVAMSVFAFASCEAVTAASAIADADQYLTEHPYTVTVSMDFDCNNSEMSEIFDAMSVEVPVTVDGKNMAMDMSMEVMPGMSASIKMTVVENILYYDMSLMGEAVKMKSTLNEEQYKEFMEENGAQLPVDSTSFESLTLENKDGKHVITCSGITTEGLNAMNEILTDAVTSAGAETAVGDLSYVLTISDGKYESMALTASYTVTAEGQTYTVSMTMNAKYAYDNVQPIVAPSDAASYTEADFDDMLG